mgnify:CR=1 FL=1
MTVFGPSAATPGQTVRVTVFLHTPDVATNVRTLSRAFQHETNPGNGRPLVQPHGHEAVYFNPPAEPLDTALMDSLYDLPFTRLPHPSYSERIPAYETVKHSIVTMRGCFGGCTFCSITEHEGRIIQSRSEDSIVREVEKVRDTVPGFTGVVSDLGGPTANMYRMRCTRPEVEARCRRLSCVHPTICKLLGTDHGPLVRLYRKARAIPGVKKVLIGSGLRYDPDMGSNPPLFCTASGPAWLSVYIPDAPRTDALCRIFEEFASVAPADLRTTRRRPAGPAPRLGRGGRRRRIRSGVGTRRGRGVPALNGGATPRPGPRLPYPRQRDPTYPAARSAHAGAPEHGLR